jgi:hypothetical protein
MNERRKEPRDRCEAAVRVWGRDTGGNTFSQKCVACNLSLSGALLSGLQTLLRCGDPIVVGYGDKKAKFRVIWSRDQQAAVQKLRDQPCPWKELLDLEPVET